MVESEQTQVKRIENQSDATPRWTRDDKSGSEDQRYRNSEREKNKILVYNCA